ncbi:ankyrin repeat domain-containing protein 29-like [Haliotis asinina]|uniref:ankyrin repeat domain-containing protein 29-like n=1 Tax=Haliotis asinina TaxID=109174 RepID=UPI003531D458
MAYEKDLRLLEASITGDLETVLEMLDEGQADINCRGMYGLTPVMWAAWNGHTRVVQFLRFKLANMSLVTDSGNTILHLACDGGEVQTVEFLLERKFVDINARNKFGKTAAEMASGKGHQKVVDLLKSFDE